MKTTFSPQQTADFCLSLSMLLHAGIGTGDAVALMAEEDSSLHSMTALLDEGVTLSDAMRQSGLPDYAWSLTEVGERTGRTEEALAALSTYYENRVRLQKRVRSAVLYPAVMLAVMLVVIGVLLVRVLPIFDSVYASLGGRLTGAAGGLLVVGKWLDGAMPVLWVILALAVAAAAVFSLAEPLRAKVTLFWRTKFGDKGINKKLGAARLAQALTMGLSSGLPVEEAVELAAKLSEGAAKERCVDCQKRLGDGAGISLAFKESGVLPAAACRLLELGQRSGSVDVSMEKIANDLTEEGETALDELVSRVEPTLVLVCSVLVGLILLSVMLPLMNIMAAIG